MDRTWVKRRIVAGLTVVPALAVNYAVIALLQYELNFEHLWILSIVLVGDIVGFAVNLWLVDFNIRIIHRYGGKPKDVT